jgi:hypothetical protein
MSRTKEGRLSADRMIDLLETVSESESPRSYSGRAMYGDRCVSITLDGDAELARLGAQLAIECDEDEREALLDLLQNTRTDGMGRGIVAYWPRLAWPKDIDEDDKEDDED